MLISKTVKITICNSNRKYYKSMGYENIKNGDVIEVEIDKLPKGSHAVVRCSCDYCGIEYDIVYKTYIRNANEIINKLACKNCIGKKVRESNMIKYGVPSPTCLESVQEKVKATTKKHYGVEHISQSLEIIKKIKNTYMEKYGVDHISKLPEIQEKQKKTRLEKYGVEYIFQSPEMFQHWKDTIKQRYGVDNPSQLETVKQKKRDTTFKNYGVEYGVQSPIIKEKKVKTMYENQSISTSYQQKYLGNLYNMVLNYPIKYYNADMCDVENKLICEYDGGGHNLSVVLGDMSEEKFQQREIVRNNVIKREGYKMFRIISSKDRLPSDDVLLKILKDSKEYFQKYPNHSWIEFNIDNNSMRNAENINGVPFDFGEIKSFYQKHKKGD